MYKGFWGWSLENVNKGTVNTKYIVESITDEKTWQKLLKTEDPDLYDKREFEKVSEAIQYYLTWYVNEKCFDIKLWEQIFVNNEMVLEQMIEPESTTKFCMRESIDREMQDRMRKAENKVEDYRKSNELYREFIESNSVLKNMFEDFMKQKEG